MLVDMHCFKGIGDIPQFIFLTHQKSEIYPPLHPRMYYNYINVAFLRIYILKRLWGCLKFFPRNSVFIVVLILLLTAYMLETFCQLWPFCTAKDQVRCVTTLMYLVKTTSLHNR